MTMANENSAPERFYQTVNFHFSVSFRPNDKDSIDTRFQSVTGLDSTIETETVKEGGENHFEHVIPVRRKYGPIFLKRGLATSDLTEWLKHSFDNADARMKPIPTVDIMLLNDEHKALMQWTINNVWPRSWKIGELNAERGEVLIETLELNYNQLIFKYT